MNFNNYQYIIEPSIFEKYIHILLIVAIISFFIKSFITIKKEQKLGLSAFNKVKLVIFKPFTAIIIVFIMAILAIQSNYQHDVEISPQYLNLQGRNLSFTVAPAPEGKKNVNDVYSASLFVNKVSIAHSVDENLCRISIDIGSSIQTIINERTKENCLKEGKAFYFAINESKQKDYPKLKNIKNAELNIQ